MTNDEKEREGSETSIIVLPPHKKHDPKNQAIVPTFNTDLAIVTYDPNKQVVNFGKGTATWCLDNIVTNKDLLSVREQIRSRQ